MAHSGLNVIYLKKILNCFHPPVLLIDSQLGEHFPSFLCCLISVFNFTPLAQGTRLVLPRALRRTSPAAAVGQQDRRRSKGRRRSIAKVVLKWSRGLKVDPELQRSLHLSSTVLWSHWLSPTTKNRESLEIIQNYIILTRIIDPRIMCI